MIRFARTRHEYPSYSDFWRLVEVSGFQTCYVDEIDLSRDVVYILTPWNGETTPALRRARAGGSTGKVIWWLLERDLADGGAVDEEALSLVDAVWVSDRSYADLHAKFDHVVLAGHPLFGAPCVAKIYDVCHLAYLWGRRQAVIDELAKRYRIAPEAFGQSAQDRFVATSRLMLNLHQYATAKIIAPIRFAVAASYGLPLVSEDVVDPSPLIDGQDFLSAPIEQIPTVVDRVLGDEDLRQRLAVRLRARLVLEHRFDLEVAKGIGTLHRRSIAS